MSQSCGRINKHNDATAVSRFQSDNFYAYGPLYEEIEVPGKANPEAEANLSLSGEANPDADAKLRLRKRITHMAWTYFVDQTKRDQDLMKEIKDIHFGPERTRSDDDQNGIESEVEEMIKGYYMNKIEEVIGEAKRAYDPSFIDVMLESSFKYMMITHGCLFLLQMFVSLGLGVNELKDRSQLSSLDLDILFGSDDEDFKEMEIVFTKSAVFPGNQIPLVVLNKLIECSFLKKVVLKKPSSSDVVKSVLYEHIVDPLRKNQLNSTDILHGLHLRLVGTARADIVENGNVDSEVGYDQKTPRATELYSKGMHFKGVSGMAISEIKIKDNVFTGKVLHLPVITFNEMTKYLYTCLKDYENVDGQRGKVVNDYLRILKDIVHYNEDVLLLKEKGIIEVDEAKINEVVHWLGNVANDAPRTCTTHHLQRMKLAISHHHLKPWYYKCLTVALVSIIISLSSLIVSVLQYLRKK